MSEAEIYEMVMMHADQMDSAYEFWLTVSFGVLIAVHFLGHALRSQIKLILCLLYVTASLIAVCLTLSDLMQIAELAESLKFSRPVQQLNGVSSILRFLLYLLGTIAVALAIFRYESWIGREDT